MQAPEEIIAIPWRTLPDGGGVMPVMELGGDGLVWFVPHPDPQSGERLQAWARTDMAGALLPLGEDADGNDVPSNALPERVGVVTADGKWLRLRVSFFRPDGECCDPTGETGGHTERWVKVPTVSAAGRDLSDEELRAEIEYVIDRHCDLIRQEIGEQIEAHMARTTRSELCRCGLIDKEEDRPHRHKHDQRRRIFAALPLTRTHRQEKTKK